MKKNLILFMNRNLGWVIVILLSITPVVRWFQINSADIALSSGISFFSMIGRVSALIGIVLYAINFILSTRIKFFEDLFGGLNRVYIAHHVIGGFALVALLIHPLSLALRYVPEQINIAANYLLPDYTSPIDWPLNFGFVAFVGLVFLLILTFLVKLPYELWLFTHKFLGLAFLFGGLHAMMIQSDTSSDTFMRWYILSISIIGILAFMYRTLLPRIFVRRENYIVKKVETPVENVYRIVMQPTKRIISYKPGQFIFISFKQYGINPEPHPFSISSSPTTNYADPESMELAVTVKALGDYTGKLKELKAGAIAEIEGAFGRFTNTRYGKPKQVWVAGGIGVTPFLSMAKHLTNQSTKKKHKSYEIHMFYVVRNKSELIEDSILQQLSNIHELNFHYYTYIGEEKGRLISADYINGVVGGLKDTDIFICGPPAMMTGLKHQFVDFRVNKHNIHTEEFSIS